MKVAPWIFIALAAPVLVLAVLLRLRRDTWGRERRYVDLWSITHFASGSLGFLLGLGLPLVLVVAIAWELFELAVGVYEYPTNRVIDVALAVAGWLLAHALI